MLMTRFPRRAAVSRAFVWVLLPALAVGLFSYPAAVRGDEPKLTSSTARELWRKGSDQFLAGDFRSASSTLEQVRKLDPGEEQVQEALSWLRSAHELAESRDALRARCYEYWVGQAQEQAREKKWSKALYYADIAMANAVDEEAFRAEPWLKEIVEHGLEEVARHKEKGEWRDAFELYSFLLQLYPKNEEYKAGQKLCRQRAHFELAYGPKSDWKSTLRDIDADVVREIVARIDSDYVRKVDFKKLCISGVENLLILAETPAAADTFPNLKDADLAGDFTSRLRNLIADEGKIQTSVRFTHRDLWRVFYRNVLAANEESVRLPESVIVDEFVAGMLEPLDEFTSVIWPSEVEEFNKHTRGEFPGVGIQITKEESTGYLRVESPLEDSPAYRAGVKPGDRITAVDGKGTADMSINQAVNVITGEPRTKVTLTILDGITGESQDLTLVRERIKIQTIRGDHRDDSKATGWNYTLDAEDGVAYVRVSAFMEKTVDDLEAALKQIRRDGAKGLILDLRYNPGGLLNSAVGMCELFLDEDKTIAKTMGRDSRQDVEFHARPSARLADLPLIILVNESSASASEIVAGALAGHREACIVGERTFGKGSVQRLIPIADNQAFLKLTTDRYYVPDADAADGWYLLNREPDSEHWGVEPHIKVSVIPQEALKIIRLRRQSDLLKGRNQSELPQEILDRRPTSQPAETEQHDEFPDVDPQIATALHVMRIKLLSRQPWALAPRPHALSRADAPPADKQPVQR